MKRICIQLIVGWMICCAQTTANGQEFRDHIKKEFVLRKPAANSVLSIDNFSGSIKVESYAGDKVIMEIDEKITAKTDAQLEKGKKEFKMMFDQNEDTVLFIFLEPYDTRLMRNRNGSTMGAISNASANLNLYKVARSCMVQLYWW
jgi:hypothetical protein